jgi:hypothetical protein
MYDSKLFLDAILSEYNRMKLGFFNAVGKVDEKIYSEILAYILDPNGLHGKRNLFLKSFLTNIIGKSITNKENEIVSREIIDEFCEGIAEIKQEEDFGSIIEEPIPKGGKIDITITNKNNKILLENKPEPKHEQLNHQLARYFNSNHDKNKKVYLIYLTPDGRKSKSAEGVPYIQMSYETDILGWLNSCKEVSKGVSKDNPELENIFIQCISLVELLIEIKIEDRRFLLKKNEWKNLCIIFRFNRKQNFFDYGLGWKNSKGEELNQTQKKLIELAEELKEGYTIPPDENDGYFKWRLLYNKKENKDLLYSYTNDFFIKTVAELLEIGDKLEDKL